MTYGPEERIWNGESCFHCGHDIHGEAAQYKDMYFCSEECLGAHLIEEHEDDIDWLDFITEEALKERWLEDSKMGDWD